jgi:hypothetical protein
MGEFVSYKDFDIRDEMFGVDTDVAKEALEETVTVFYLVYHYYSA